MAEEFTPEEFLRVYQAGDSWATALARWEAQRPAAIERPATFMLLSPEVHRYCFERERDLHEERDHYVGELRKYTDAKHPPNAIREQWGVRWPEGDETAAVDEKHARMAIEWGRGVLLRRVIGPWQEAV